MVMASWCYIVNMLQTLEKKPLILGEVIAIFFQNPGGRRDPVFFAKMVILSMLSNLWCHFASDY